MNKYFFSALMALVATGCTTDSMPLSSSSFVSGSCLTLNTRTPDASYEVHYYVADTEGVGTNVSFSNLPPGDYQIYAVSSDNLSGFNLPTTEEASPTATTSPWISRSDEPCCASIRSPSIRYPKRQRLSH